MKGRDDKAATQCGFPLVMTHNMVFTLIALVQCKGLYSLVGQTGCREVTPSLWLSDTGGRDKVFVNPAICSFQVHRQLGLHLS